MSDTPPAEWIRQLLTVHPQETLPQVRVVATEQRRSTSYHFRGKDRRDSHVVFQYTLDGEGRFGYRGRSYPVPAGTGFLCDVCDPEMSYYLPAESPYWYFLWISISGPGFIAAVTEYNARHGHLVHMHPDHPMIKSLLAFQHLPETARLLPWQGAQLATNLLTAIEGAAPALEPTRLHLVNRATALIHDRSPLAITVTELAERLGVSREHLTRAFSAELGLSPHAYSTRQRLLRACQLLATTSQSVKEIAHACGYPNTAQFTRAFKRALRMPPTVYRAGGHTPLF